MTRLSRCYPWMWCAVLLLTASVSAQKPAGVKGRDLVQKPAPEFARTDLSGQQIDLKNYRGKVVLLNFWATWCAPCQVELPKFQEWQKRYGADGLQVLAVSMDDGDAPVRRTVRKLHLSIPVVLGDAKLGDAYGDVLGLPVTFLIDRKGIVVAKIKGETDLEAMELRVKRLLGR